MFAVYAAVCLALLSGVFCVLSAVFSSRASRAAKALRSTSFLQGELIEIRDYLGKMDSWAKRINAREANQESRARRSNALAQSSTDVSGLSAKDELRRRAGLIAGQPARHIANGSE